MELDDLKSTWQTLGRHLEQQNTLALLVHKERKLERAQNALRPLFWGQIAQILVALLLIGASASYWSQHLQTGHQLAAGLVMHLYGVGMILFAVRTIILIHAVDYAAPVVAIQRQIETLRTFYIRHSLIIGLPWLILWIPLMMVLFGLFGVDLGTIFWTSARPWIISNIAFGILAILAAVWFRRWSLHPSRARLAKTIDDTLSGTALGRTRSFLDQIARFEAEPEGGNGK